MDFNFIRAVRTIICKGGKFLILKRSGSDGTDPDLWDLPGGNIAEGEQIIDALEREVFEEIGLAKESNSICGPVGLVTGVYRATEKMVIAIYLCDTKKTTVNLNKDHSDYKWVEYEELSNYETGRVLSAVKSFLPDLIITGQSQQNLKR